jgi:hypothetical protein
MSSNKKERKYMIGVINEMSDFKQEGKTPSRRIIIGSNKYYFYEEADRTIKINENDEVSFLYYENDNGYRVGNNLSFPAKNLEEILKIAEEKKKNKFSRISQETLSELKILNESEKKFLEEYEKSNQKMSEILSSMNQTLNQISESFKKITGVLK